MPRSKRVTLDAISHELKLSTSSVSRALRNDPLIHPETRARVSEMAMRMGYQGRSRRGPQAESRSRTIGVLFAASSLVDVKRHALTMGYLQGMTSEAGPANLLLNIHTVPQERVPGKAEEFPFENLEVDAWILAGQHEAGMVARLAQRAPLITLARAYPEARHDLISSDDRRGITGLVDRLVGLGHRRFIWIGYQVNSFFTKARLAGFLEGIASNKLNLGDQKLIDVSISGGKLSNSKKILDAVREGATALVAYSDYAAHLAIESLARGGISVPSDVSVTGFDAHPDLNITSYNPNLIEMGRAAIRAAVWRMENPSAATMQLVVGGRMVDGPTIGPAKIKD